MDVSQLLALRTLNENTYYGKNPHLIKLEVYFESLVEIYRNKNLSKAYVVIEKIENEIEELFNFSCVYVETHMVAGIEAYTFPVYVSQFRDAFDNSPFDVKSGKFGPTMANKKHSPSIHVVLSAGVIADMGFTGKELLAVMLHEIGHSFDRRPAKIFGNIVIYGNLKMADSQVKINNKDIKEVKEMRTKYKKDKEFQQKLLDQYKETKKQKKQAETNYISGQKMFLTQFFSASLLTLLSPFILYSNTLNFFPYINKMDAEKFSDSFAVAFGYSEELSSGLMKLENFAHKPTKQLENEMTPFTRFFYIYNIIIIEIIGGNLSTHPETFKRLQYMSEYLEVCINEEENPKLKEEMIKSKKRVDELYTKFTENELTLKSETKKKFSDLFQAIFNRPDISDLLSSFRHGYYAGLDFND